MKTEQENALSMVSKVAAVGGVAGVSLASIFGAPLLIPALVGGGIACIAGAVLSSKTKS